ncbi:MAG: FG-GAP-like repeat-containing protein [Pseudomonadota bacterium]
METFIRLRGGFALIGLLCALTPAHAAITFEDTSSTAGVAGSATETFGAAWGDYDGDVYPDLYSNNHRDYGQLWRNNGDGTFSDVSTAADVSRQFGPQSRFDRDAHGSSWADINNDGNQDLSATLSVNNGYYLINNGNGGLVDRRTQLNLTLAHDNGSRQPIWFDANNDGLLDLKIVGFRENGSNVFRQNSNGTFSRIANQLGMTCPNSQWAQLLDVNGTGPLELMCGNQGGFPSRVWNYASGTGSQISFPFTNQSRDVIAGDFDNDGRQDIIHVLGTQRPNQAVKAGNNSVEAHIEMSGNKTKTIRFNSTGNFQTDLDNDNWNYIAKRVGNLNNIYIGASGYRPTSFNLNLQPSGQNLGIQSPGNRHGFFVGYVNGQWRVDVKNNFGFNNGYLTFDSSAPVSNVTLTPLLSGDQPRAPRVQLNRAGGFIDATGASNLPAILCITGVAADFDNDMDLDLFFGCRGGAANFANRVFENLGNARFREINGHGADGRTGSAVGGGAGTTESVVVADYDLDGYMDVFATNGLNLWPKMTGGPKAMFRNTGAGNNWIQIDLVGVASNRDAVGAKVTATAGGVTQYREQNGGYHRWSQNHKRIHFGLAQNATVNLTITWPSGAVDQYFNVSANALYRATEDQGLVSILQQSTDSDNDGLTDDEEVNQYGTDPQNPDTDGGGALDGAEIAAGTNPLNPTDDDSVTAGCGPPLVDPATERGIYVHRDCNTGDITVLATAGGGFVQYVGEVTSTSPIEDLAPVSFEGDDRLDTDSDPNVVDFLMKVTGQWTDSFRFALEPAAESCLTVTSPGNAQLFAGVDATPVAGNEVSLPDWTSCSGQGVDVRLSVADASADEDSGSVNVLVSLDGPAPADVTFEVMTIAESATDGADYQGLSAVPFTIPLGSSSVEIPIVLEPDDLVEGPETFRVVVGGVSGAVINDAVAHVTIQDSDAAPFPCGHPVINAGAEQGLFVSRSCGSDQVRLIAGSAGPFREFRGSVDAGVALANVQGTGLESTDTLSQPSATELQFVLKVLNAGVDQVDFELPTGSGGCVALAGNSAQQIFVGPDKVPAGSSVSLDTGASCN